MRVSTQATAKLLVLVEGLKPGTTYYYAVAYVRADGIRTGLKSATKQFTTRQHP